MSKRGLPVSESKNLAMVKAPENQTRQRSLRSSQQESNDLFKERGKAAYRAKASRFSNRKTEERST